MVSHMIVVTRTAALLSAVVPADIMHNGERTCVHQQNQSDIMFYANRRGLILSKTHYVTLV